jgi:hypothetical protein
MRTGKVDRTFCPREAGDVASPARANRRGRAAVLMLALFALTSSASAGWRDEAAPGDVERLSHLSEARAKGLQEAASGNPADVAVIQSILQSGAVPANAQALKGTWRCRSMKLGGVSPEIVYSWFKCRISDKGGRLFFEKFTGSTRTSGYLYPEGEGYVYLGAAFVASYGPPEKRPVYSGPGAAAGAQTTPDDQIGLLSQLYDGRLRLELPAPVQESSFDVIELKR